MRALRDRVGRVLEVDLRSLATFRIAVAGALLFDLATRSTDLVAHYTEAGACPVRPLHGLDLLSVHAWLSPWPAAVAALFGVAMLAALALMLGWRTRVASILCWYLLASLQLRNPAVSRMGGDTLLRMLLFWAMFLPLGARASLDARRRGDAQGPGRLRSLPGAALLIQMALMYVTTGFLKQGASWQTNRALWYALQLDYWVTPLGEWLRQREAWLPALSFASLWIERLGAFLAFVPFRTDAFRMAAVILFVGFHLSLAAFLDVGPFPLFCIVGWTAFLPSRWWDEWWPRLRRAAPVPTGPAPVLAQPRWIQAVAAACLLYVLVYVIGGAALGADARPLPTVAIRAGRGLGLNQSWTMFAPEPSKFDAWPLVEGELADGRHVDLLHGGDFSLSKPARIPESLPSFRWRLFFRSGTEDWLDPSARPRTLRLYRGYARYLCRTWRPAAAGGAPLVVVRILHGLEVTLPDGPMQPGYESVLEHRCRRP